RGVRRDPVQHGAHDAARGAGLDQLGLGRADPPALPGGREGHEVRRGHGGAGAGDDHDQSGDGPGGRGPGRLDRGRQGRGPGDLQRASVRAGVAGGDDDHRRDRLLRPVAGDDPGEAARAAGGHDHHGGRAMSARSLIRETSPAARKARRVRSASLGAGVGAFGRAAAAGLFLWATSSAAPLAAQSTIPGSQGGTFLIRGGTVVVAPGRVLEGASVLIRDGRIAAVGRDVGDAAGATVIDASGKYVYPGMIDSGSTLGLYEIGSVAGTLDISEMGRFNPHLRALTAVNPHSELIPVTRVNGVTTAIVQPSGGVISGQAALVRLDGWTPKEMGLRAPAALGIRYPRAGGG